jgi:hypothetical protein
MKTFLDHLRHALLIWACSPNGGEWEAAAGNIFAETVEND